jgi:hypothetical protein
MSVFTHISEENALEKVREDPGGGGRPVGFGKPGGFWLAPDMGWIDLISSRKSWEIAGDIVAQSAQGFVFTKEFYDVVFRDKPADEYVEGTVLQTSAPKTTHFVYQFTIDPSKFVTDLKAESKGSIFTLTAGNLAAFLAKVEEVHADIKENRSRYPSTPTYTTFQGATGVARIGWFHQTYMADHWAGIMFDESLFTPELKAAHKWIPLLEIPSLCLWHPGSFLGLPRIEEPNPQYESQMSDLASWRANYGKDWLPEKTIVYGKIRDEDLKAVLTWVGTPLDLRKKLNEGNPYSRYRLSPMKPYLSKMWVAGVTKDSPHLVLILRNGELVPGAKPAFEEALKGGRRRTSRSGRGRTFRRKAGRRNKNGGRPTRKSKHGRNQ